MNKSKVCNSRNKLVVSQVKSCDANSNSSEIAKLTHAVNQQTSAVTTAMTTILKQFQATPPPAFVKAVEEICVTCGGMANQIQPPGFAQPNVKNNQNLFGQPQGFNHGNNFNPEQSYQAPTQQNQVVPLNELEKVKRMNEAKMKAMQTQINMVKNELRNEMKNSIQASLFNQTNEIKNIMARHLQMNTTSTLGSGSLPSNTIANPKGGGGTLMVYSERSGSVKVSFTRSSTFRLMNGGGVGTVGPSITRPLRVVMALSLPFGLAMVLLGRDPDPKVEVVFIWRWLAIIFLISLDIDSSLKDSIDQSNLANPTDNFVYSMPEMFTDEHAPDYSSPPIFDEYNDDFLEVESDTENFYDDPFDSKGEKIKESKLLIDKLDLPCDFLPSEYDSFISQDFSKVDAKPSTNNEDKDFDPLFYEPLFFKEVPRSKMQLPFSSKNEEKFSNQGFTLLKKFILLVSQNYLIKAIKFSKSTKFSKAR
nr:hypothetical protein [Tanacetum cinerariifolium]